jgi:hypothetical protein
MKRVLVYSLSLLFLGSVSLFNACNPAEPEPPVVVITSNSDGWDAATSTFTGMVGDSLILDITVTAEGGFNTLRITKGSANLVEKSRDTEGQTSYSYTFGYEIVADDVDQDVTITIAGIDDEGLNDEKTVTITAQAAPVDVVKYTARLMYAPVLDKSSKTFLSTDNGNTYSRNDIENTTETVSPLIDFGYYFGNSDMASIVSPAAYPSGIYDLSAWGTRNETMMKLSSMESGHFDMISNNTNFDAHWDMLGANFMDDADGDVINLAVNDLVAFTLDDDKGAKKGFFIVRKIEGTMNSTDYIEIDVVVRGE